MSESASAFSPSGLLFLARFREALCFASGAANAKGQAAKPTYHSSPGFTAFVRAAPHLK